MGSQGIWIVSNEQLVLLCFALSSLHVQTLMLTDVQTPFLGTPLVPLKSSPRALRARRGHCVAWDRFDGPGCSLGRSNAIN